MSDWNISDELEQALNNLVEATDFNVSIMTKESDLIEPLVSVGDIDIVVRYFQYKYNYQHVALPFLTLPKGRQSSK